MLGKFACTNLLAKFYAVSLLNSGVVIYLPCPGIFFSTAVRVVLVDKLVILGILLLTLFILALRAAVVAKLAILCISLLTFFYLQSFDLNVTCILLKHYIIYSTSLTLFKSIETDTNLSTSILSTLLFKLLKLLGTFFN